jgi:hypothetical protein
VKVMYVEDLDHVKIFFDNFIHAHFYRKHYRGMSAYNNGAYTIEILLKGHTLRLEYDDKQHWLEVLHILDEVL